MYASRNITKCTKDCLCLFICPTGATDTETGQIDKTRCIDGCRLCVDACPSKAIFLVMENYPEPEPKNPEISEEMMKFCSRKFEEEKTAGSQESKFAQALSRSMRIVAEDCAREAGFMLPQSQKVKQLLEEL